MLPTDLIGPTDFIAPDALDPDALGMPHTAEAVQTLALEYGDVPIELAHVAEAVHSLALGFSAGTVTPIDPARPVPESRRPLLAVRLRGPDRAWTVLGSEDARGVVAEGLTASADVGGPLTAGFTLRRDPAAFSPDLAAFSEMDIEIGTALVWGGRVWETPGTSGDERSLSVSGKGWQSHLEDDVLSTFWVHDRLADWRDTRSLMGAPLANYVSDLGVNNQDGAIVIGWPSGYSYAPGQAVGLTIDQDAQLGARARAIVIEATAVNPNAFVQVYVRQHDTEDPIVGSGFDDFSPPGGFSFAADFAADPTITYHRMGTVGATRRYLSIFMWCSPGSGTTTMEHLLRIRRIRLGRELVHVDVDAATGPSVLTASQVVEDLLTSGATPLLDQTTLLIDQSGLIDGGTKGIPHLTTNGYQSPRAVIDAANAYHGWRAGVDAHKRLFFLPRTTAPVYEVGGWSGAEFSDQSTGSAENVYNRVIVQGRTGAGGALTVIRTSAVPALERLGITRTHVLQVDAVLTEASAEVIGDAWLADHARSQFKGALTVVGMGGVREVVTGRPVHLSELLAATGEMIRFSHLIDPDTGGQGRDGYITSVTYTHDDESAAVSVDNEQGRLSALLQRVGALQAVGS